jgi:hypothetical protein
MATKPQTSLLDELEKSLAKLMKKMDSDLNATLTDKMKIYDRVLKLSQIKMKINDDNETSGFDDDD